MKTETASASRKSLVLAWVSNVLPGLGLVYVGNKSSGVAFMIVGAVFLALCLTGLGVIVGLPLYLLTSLCACIASVMAASSHNKAL